MKDLSKIYLKLRTYFELWQLNLDLKLVLKTQESLYYFQFVYYKYLLLNR